MEQQTSQRSSSFYVLVSVFFFWGFIAASNGVFIPFCKSKFNLSQFQSQFIDSAFYFAYYIGAYLLFLFSALKRKDILNSWGYKNGIVYGLMLSVVGAFLMFPALASNNFSFILAALFIIALGFSLQQTSANPFAISLGDPASGSHRLNMAGGLNSFGTTIGPIIFALALLGTTKLDEGLIKQLSLSTVQWLYVLVGFSFFAAALLFNFSKKLPDGKADANIENESKATALISLITIALVVVFTLIFIQNTGETVNHQSNSGLYLLLGGIVFLVGGLLYSGSKSKTDASGWGALKFPQLTLGMIAIFVYVGVEVAIQSNLGEYLKHLDYRNFLETNATTTMMEFNNMLASKEIKGYWTELTPMLISLYWGSLMIGRWAGAISIFNLSSGAKKLALVLIPYLAFLVVIISNIIGNMSNKDIDPIKSIYPILPYAFVILIQIVGFFMGGEKPAKTLMIFGVLGAIALVVGILTSGAVSVFALVSGGLFCSVMWPCIFSLATSGLGKYTSQGASFLIMMILGGALIPPLQGKLADIAGIGIHSSYWISVLCFAYLAFYAWKVRSILKSQGIDYDSATSSGH